MEHYSLAYISEEKLPGFAASEARLLRVEGEGSAKSSINLLKRSFSTIERSHSVIERRYGGQTTVPAACEWLLDNWYMVQREYRSAYAALRSARHLRLCQEQPLIVELCRALLHAGQGAVTEERSTLFLQGFQTVTVLRRQELLLFPAALRSAVIEGVAQVCRSMQYASDTASHAKELEALFGTLRLFSVLDTEKLIRSVDISEEILSRDPSGDYANMDSGTRQDYLARLTTLARAQGLEEHVLARKLIKQAAEEGRHVGFTLFPPKKHRGAGLYITANIVLTLFLSLLLSFAVGSPGAAVLLLLPVSELVKSLLDLILLHLIPPKRLPRMDTEKGVPPEGRSICVLSALLTSPDSGGKLAESLEQFRLANRSAGKNVCFGILADLPAADSPETEEDEKILRAARSAINGLNFKYGGGFYLFTRERRFDGERYTGHERKRGALLELAKLLCDRDSALRVTGDKDALAGVRYIITLDSDTKMYPGAVSELIGAMLHPLNTPRLDKRRHVVTEGHAVIHPRISTGLKSANATDFALIFAGAGGSDPYGALCGELYMDAFDSGGFAGKGILDAKMLLDCSEAHFPEGRILSHDALEGAYLRGAFMGDTEFSDSFPAKPLSYYRRLHRWVRGDWQNAPWLFGQGRDLRDIDRWRLLDSLRRSLIAPATFIAILAGFFLPAAGLRLAAWAALLALLSRLFISLAEGGRKRRETVRLRRYTRLLTGVGGAIVQTFMRLWLLPFEAWVCLSAAVTALWRMLVSGQKLLEWETAAQSDSRSGSLAAHIKTMWFPLLAGALCLLLSPAIIGKSAGLMWLLSPVAAAALALPARRENTLSRADREYLRLRAGETWRYFRDFSTAEDNYLPPDNFQEQPPVGVAHRTSPTNIGLAAASAAAAMDMELIQSEECVEYIRRMTDTLLRMPRCRGHYYNWYDTRTLLPLHPAFVSTVDSGNLYAGLLVAAAAMEELGQRELAERLRSILEQMDFSPLYDGGRGLFYICYDASKERGAGGWYDLMASEAMLTSYIAIAKGDVPKKHWRRLSRAQLQKDGYRGLASWTGTMFEYLMPELFLPLYRGSLLYESSRFCLYAQKRRVFAGKPWGISESAFFSLDSSLSYRYKAHGCPALALKRGQEEDMVVSPYSSFLALCAEPESAVKNLRRLERFGALGRYGFIEALDFTPGRCRSDSGEPVRCTMAHHAGMSILAAANAVKDGCVQRRFLSDPAMAAHTALLQERLPEDGIVIRRDLSPVPEKPDRAEAGRWQKQGGVEDEGCCLLSNGAYELLLRSDGGGQAKLSDRLIYLQAPKLRLDGKNLFPAKAEHWEFSEDQCAFRRSLEGLEVRLTVFAASGDCGELRTIQCKSDRDREVSLEFSFVPVLAAYNDYVNHTAFWRLGIFAQAEGRRLLLRRVRRGGAGELWLCLACSGDARFSADKKGGLGWLSEPLVRVRLDLHLRAGETAALRFALCAGFSQKEAVEGAERILAASELDCGGMLGASATLLGLSAGEIGAAMDMLPALTKPRLHEAAPARELWPFGISGDLPILCCDSGAKEAESLLLRFCLLKSCGLNADLVYLSDEQGEYQRPFFRRVSQSLSRFSLEALIDSPGGVHFAPLSAKALIESRAAWAVGREQSALPEPPSPVFGAPRSPGSIPEHRHAGRAFEFYVNQSLPFRPWQLILTNGRYGYIASDCGSGCMWLENAREMRIDPPPLLPEDISGSERLWLETEKGPVSLFAANDGYPCHVSFSPGLAVWEKEIGGALIKTSAFIPGGIDARVFMVEGADDLELGWSLSLVLGAADGGSVRCGAEDGIFRAENPESYLPGVEFRAVSSSPALIKCDFAPAAMLLRCTCRHITVLACGCCSEAEIKELCRPSLALAALSSAASRWAALLDRLEIRTRNRALDAYMNGWAAYQTIACRIQGRCSLYQSGGAIGFRDQLQDSVNMLLIDPHYAREQILDCCRHQYVEGDVMHWWHPHPEGDKGVRTRCSDDLLWLTWALCQYVEATGDEAICALEESYVNSSPLTAVERDRYERPEVSDMRASVLDHAKAALERCAARGFGPNGLPWFGSGDWNDGLDAVEGESVWLGWFFSCCADMFAGLLRRLGRPGAERYEKLSRQLALAAKNSFNGRWYMRGRLESGEALGGDGRIDSIAQSWAALCPHGDKAHADAALENALCKLVDREHRLVKLFDPPYSPDESYLGYISSYGEGFRENGGQYTHGAVWLAIACFRRGRPDAGYEILNLLLPENHLLQRYGGEPFVLAADVYAAPGHEGEAGWTWYTGSAGWYFRAVTEELLGLRLRDGKLYVSPSLPAALEGYTADWTDFSGKSHRIEVKGEKITVDGEKYSGEGIG